MAKMVGVWIWVAPRDVSDDVNLTVGGTVILTDQDMQHIGEDLGLKIRIMDEDPGRDDKVGEVKDTFPGPFKVGWNSFTTQVVVPHDDVADSEPFWESTAELYAKVAVYRRKVTEIKTDWDNSQTEKVRFE
jgi:hypothetical protein